jgi:DUF3096 family protein
MRPAPLDWSFGTGASPGHTSANASRRASFPKKADPGGCNFGQFLRYGEPIPAAGVSSPGSREDISPGLESRFIRPPSQRVLPMTLTIAHITPIMSLVAGVLILLMPRLLNFIVAIFLILNGLIGLGLLKWLHF